MTPRDSFISQELMVGDALNLSRWNININLKTAVKLCSINDPTQRLVREFDEHAADKGHQSLVKEAVRFVE